MFLDVLNFLAFEAFCFFMVCSYKKSVVFPCLFLYIFFQYLARIMKISSISDNDLQKMRSSHRRCSVKIGVLRNLAKFIGKTPKACNFIKIKKSLWHRCFPVNSTKFLRTPFLQNTFGRMLQENTHLLFRTQFPQLHQLRSPTRVFSN